MSLQETIKRVLREENELPLSVRRRSSIIDKVIDNMLPNMYPCDYNSADHFIEGILDEIRWFLPDFEDLQGIERIHIEDYILDYKYDELTDYFNERCIVLKNMSLQESIKRILREETEDFMSCLPMFRQFKMPENGFVVIDKKYGFSNIDKFFWKVVDLVDYKSDNDYDRIREMFLNMNRFCGVSGELFNALEKSMRIKMDALDEMWGDDIREVGDDSWSDLRADIISRGRDFYNKALTDFDMVQRMANEIDYRESFSYAFPYAGEIVNYSNN